MRSKHDLMLKPSAALTLFLPLWGWHHRPVTHSKLNWSNIKSTVFYDQCGEKKQHYETTKLQQSCTVFRSTFNHLQSFCCFEFLIPPVCHFALGGGLPWARTHRDREVNAVHTTATWGLDEASANLLWSALRPTCLLISVRGVKTGEVNWTERSPYSPDWMIHRPNVWVCSRVTFSTWSTYIV